MAIQNVLRVIGSVMHIGIIMDGNGRWAADKGWKRAYGHKVGVKRVEECIRAAPSCGIKALTLYAFSTENWKRPQPEIEVLFNLMRFQLNKKAQELKDANIKVRFIGSRCKLSSSLIQSMEFIEKLTNTCNSLCINVAIDYGGRDEIVSITKQIVDDIANGNLDVKDINEALLDKKSELALIGPPDLIIRTGGEKRLSNFLLWHSAYSELAFTDSMWPDFTADKLIEQVELFKKRERKYGNLLASKVS